MANSAFSDATHAANRHSDIAITSVASNDILKFDGTNWVNSTTSPDSSIAVTQSSHGFAVGEALKSSGSNGAYAKAQADSAANAEVVGIITVVTDSNNFTLTLNGMIRIAGAVPNETAGTALFLSASSAGALTATEPSTSGQISKPVAIVTTANTEMILVVYRGETISTGVTNWDVNGLELVLDADGDTSLTADTDDQIDVKISGADDFRFTANKLDVLSGSTLEINGTLDINGTELILDANGNTSITADTDDQIDIKISGADDFRFTANSFNILSGSTITIDSGATITNSGTATGFSSGPSQASQTETRNQSNVDKYVPPDLMTNVPGVSRTASTGNITFASALGTTLTNLDNWSISIDANEFVAISIVLYLSLTTDGDFKYAFTGPSSLQMHSQGILVGRDSGAVIDAAFESAPDGTGVPMIANTNGEFVLRIDAGFMSDGTAGTIQFQYAQNTSDDSDEHLRRQSTFVASRSWH